MCNSPAMLDSRRRLPEAHHRLALLDGHVVALPRADVHLNGRRVDGSAGRAQQRGSHGNPSPAWDARSSHRPPAASSVSSARASRPRAGRRTARGKSRAGSLLGDGTGRSARRGPRSGQRLHLSDIVRACERTHRAVDEAAGSCDRGARQARAQFGRGSSERAIERLLLRTRPRAELTSCRKRVQ